MLNHLERHHFKKYVPISALIRTDQSWNEDAHINVNARGHYGVIIAQLTTTNSCINVYSMYTAIPVYFYVQIVHLSISRCDIKWN